MTQEMYGATGKVGNKTYYRANGKTVARQIVAPKNPKTTAQTYQRVIAAQVGKDYKMFKSIVDHSFQGKSIGFQCMNEFRKLNMRRARRRASEIQQSGNSVSQFYNFQPIGSTKWVPDAVILSQGELPKVASLVKTDDLGLYIGAVAVSANTYAGVCEALGLKRGDQLTFVTVEKQNGEYVVFKSRVILDPRNPDGSGAAMSSAFITDNAITNPNWRNDFHFTYLDYDAVNNEVGFAMGQNGSTLVASAIIVSRKDGDQWLRSNSELVLSEAAIGSDLCSLYDAVENSYAADELDLESEMYLNNAGTGGSQGAAEDAPSTGSDDPYYSNNVSINGASQNVAGGSVVATAPITAINVTGQNLADSEAYLTIDNGAAVQPTSKTATTIAFTGINATAGQTIRVYKASGSLWFTVTASSPDNGGSDES